MLLVRKQYLVKYRVNEMLSRNVLCFSLLRDLIVPPLTERFSGKQPNATGGNLIIIQIISSMWLRVEPNPATRYQTVRLAATVTDLRSVSDGAFASENCVWIKMRVEIVLSNMPPGVSTRDGVGQISLVGCFTRDKTKFGDRSVRPWDWQT